MTDIFVNAGGCQRADRGRGLARVRNERGWTYDKLEAESGVHRRTLIAMEHGRTNGRLESWFRVPQAFGIPIGTFMSVL